ncbi:MAG: DUF2723 domain-containing protein [Anaerolineae bacterium]|nr:DUF2723 domain-containing protein [Anaerolineae bacterium]
MMRRLKGLHLWLPLVAFLTALGLYVRTLVPDVFVADFAEFQYQPARLGLPHPNGFPLYMLLGWAWSHLPWGSVAWRMNLLSAVGGALAVALTAAFAQRLSGRISVGALAGGLLALSPTFWSFSVAAERYTLNLSLLVAALWAAWEAGEREGRGRVPGPLGRVLDPPLLGWLSAGPLSLGLATHPSDALLIPFWLGYLAWRLPSCRRSGRFWAGLAMAGLAPLALYLYVPWRWAAYSRWPLLPGIGRSSAIYRGMVHVWYEPLMRWDLLRHYLLGLSGYAAGLVTGGWREALQSLSVVWPYWLRDVPWWLLALAVAGALRLWRRAKALLFALMGFAVLLTLMVAYIGQGKNDAYLLPAFWSAFFLAGQVPELAIAAWEALEEARGKKERGQRVTKATRYRGGVPSLLRCLGASLPHYILHPASYVAADRFLLVPVALSLLALLWVRYPLCDFSRRTEVRQSWEVVLAHPLEDGAGLLGHWSDLTPLWYLQQVEGRRTDLWGLFPPDPAQVIQPWLESGRPLYLAAPLHGWAPDLAERYGLVSWGKLVRILLPGQEAACPPLGRSLDVPEGWPLAITGWDIEEPLESARPSTLQFCWQARAGLPRQTFLRLRLRPADGTGEISFNEPLISEWYPARTIPAGAWGLAVVPIRLPLGMPPGTYTADLVAYRLGEDGSAEPSLPGAGGWPGVEPVVLGDVTVMPAYHFTRAALDDEVAPLVSPRAGPLALRAWRVSRLAVRPGDPLRLELLWEVREPSAAPLALAVGFRRAAGGALAASPEPIPLPLPDGPLSPGLLVRSVHTLSAPRGVGDRVYLLEVRLRYGDRWLAWWPTGRLVVGLARVRDRPHIYQVPEGLTPAGMSFGGVARLAGYAIRPAEVAPCPALTVTLYWQALAETDISYSVFVHLTDGEGQIVAQHDGPPAGGTLRTSLWVPGEVITDPHSLSIPGDMAPGEYVLRLGLYDPRTMQRLQVTAADGTPLGDAVLLQAGQLLKSCPTPREGP